MAKTIAAWIREKITAEVLVAFVLGITLGLVVLGWWLWPVQWVNSNPADLMLAHKDTYMQLIADSYALTGNMDAARNRLGTLKASGEKAADQVAALDRLAKARLAAGDGSSAIRLQALSSALGSPPAATAKPTLPAKPAATRSSQLLRVFGIVFFLALLGAGLVLLFLQLRQRQGVTRRRTPPARQGAPGTLDEMESGIASTAAETHLARFETTYNSGDESYDVNYSIESPAGEFLGECGVSAVEALGIGQPGNMAAFEVWLFDKDDVRTETKVLVSERALTDASLHDKLAEKGELIKVEPGQVITLETANLRLDTSIMDVVYGSGSDTGLFATLGTRLEVSRK
jgi:hypothetical protein